MFVCVQCASQHICTAHENSVYFAPHAKCEDLQSACINTKYVCFALFHDFSSASVFIWMNKSDEYQEITTKLTQELRNMENRKFLCQSSPFAIIMKRSISSRMRSWRKYTFQKKFCATRMGFVSHFFPPAIFCYISTKCINKLYFNNLNWNIEQTFFDWM